MSRLLGYETRPRPFAAAATIVARTRTTPPRIRQTALAFPVLIQPLGFVQDRSTHAVIVDSVCVARAIEYVRHHLSEVFGVEAVLHASGVPRRSLELAFKRALGCTPYQFIIRARLARARELLALKPPRKLSEIAYACGFADLRRFRLVFRRELGMTPAQHRAALSGDRITQLGP
ncbi:MAG TPA: AraC family transcriptional regulator [Tepidisphaeraceae bacterium]|nr:AraC family transcriptional regulator [Tepidisphaeraceae bacterium]